MGRAQKYDEFYFGYALTVHKSQGSQWDNVYLFDESWAFREDRARHLYTAVTRAAEKITVVR
ncbi:MAG: exodeoxyribonuclease-5 [Maritalea sp.]|jgi:exodeoxyribonuclease-5